MKLLINISLLFASLGLYAQENPYTYVVDSASAGGNMFVPTGVRIGADLLGPVLHAFDNRSLSYEFTAELDVDKYYLVVEGGYQQFNEKNDNIDYSMKGNFFRIGPEANFLSKDNLLNSFSFGLRYAWGSFNETATGNVIEPNWGPVPVNFDVQNKSSWVEMTTGVKVRLYKNFFTGYIFRFRFLRRTTVPNVPFSPYYVPGFGFSDKENSWGFRYYIMYRIQWSKKPIRAKRNN